MADCSRGHRRVRVRDVYAHVNKEGFMASGKPSLKYTRIDYCTRCELVLSKELAVRPKDEAVRV